MPRQSFYAVPLYYAVCRVEAEILSLSPPLINYNPTASPRLISPHVKKEELGPECLLLRMSRIDM